MNFLRMLALLFCSFYLCHAQHEDQETFIYREELELLKNSPDYKNIFKEKDITPVLRSIQTDVKNYQHLAFPYRVMRFALIPFDVLMITPTLMPKLYAYVEEVCKKAEIPMTTVFVSKKKGFMNAAAQKLLTSTGCIMIGQEFFYEVSDQEIEAIIAHEIGHIKYNHVNKSILVLIQATMLARNLIGKFKRNSMIIHPLEYKARQFALCSATRMIHSLIIGKSFERQADEFAYKVMGRGKGFIRFFERMEEEDRKKEADFVETYGIIENSKDNLRLIDRALLKTRYYFALVEDKAFTWIYHNTRLGAHPSHEERIKAAKKYLAEHPEAA